jgi:hypothetical protein
MRTGTRAYAVRTYYVVEHRYVVTVDYEPTSITKPLRNLSLELNKSIRKDENPLLVLSKANSLALTYPSFYYT